jgi:hypothetical protein
MPYSNGEWFPPSLFIATYGVDAFEKGQTTGVWPEGFTPNNKAKKEEDTEVSTAPLDAREGFKFGADPELFVFKDGVPVTAEGLIPGTKAEPHKVECGAVQVDGMAAEFNIDPASSFKDFNHNIEAVMKQLEALLPPSHELRAVPAVTFDKEVFDAAPEKAKELGCQPDYNAWKGQVNPPPKDPNNPFLRTASGHIHIGWTEGADLSDPQHIMNCVDLVKQLDWYLGGWSVKVDADPTRRQLYGRAGALRFKDYGVEYRVLSNFWITSRERRLAVWNRLQYAIEAMSKSFMPDNPSAYNTLLQESINSSVLNAQLAKQFKYPLISLTPQTGSTMRGYKAAPIQVI